MVRAETPATLEEVARAANVSRATVSRVVNGDRRVREDTRSAVEAAVRDLGYVPNRAARSLVTRRSGSVGVVIPEPTAQLFGDPFFPRVLRGIGDALAAEEMQLVLLMPQVRADELRVGRYLAAGHVDGVLLVSLHGPDPLPDELRARGIPVVVGGRPPSAGITYVDVDNRRGAAMAVEHLLADGRRQVATIAGPQDMPAGSDRLAGYHEALGSAGLPINEQLVEIADFSLEGGRSAMERLLARAPRLDAVFVASDLMGVGALSALQAGGRSVPDDVAVIGFDDSPLAAQAQPPLSSVRQPIEEMGREMAQLLIQMVTSRERVARRVILATELVIRASSRR
ncbi:MAG TPA: LacI family DNA-binding transcriptional regulator [Candidatus Limnocylindria bacterium]|jgi:DNA-binding LacI/PurR family transcriptional regulator|nr:LacI family DNA-binding transcriptional regulator [Candidatus Limnocylindria bacterium]